MWAAREKATPSLALPSPHIGRMSLHTKRSPPTTAVPSAFSPRRRSRPVGGTREPEAETVGPLHLPPFPSHRAVFGTDRSGQGRAVSARRRRIFCGFEKILRSGPLTARTVLEHGAEGKGGPGLSPQVGIRRGRLAWAPQRLAHQIPNPFFGCFVCLAPQRRAGVSAQPCFSLKPVLENHRHAGVIRSRASGPALTLDQSPSPGAAV